MVVRLLPFFLLLSSCDDPCPRGSMLDSDEGLVVTEAEHPTGWGETECAACHVHERLHRIGCTEGVDLLQVRAVVDEQGDTSCMGCHGSNGTEELGND
jgi:hypothetical protein